MTQKTVVGYVRVSTEEQANEGISLDAQKEALKAYCTLKELSLVSVFEDPGISAAKPLEKRPQGKALLTHIKKCKPDGVVAWKLDRLFRNAVDCLQTVEKWQKKNTNLHLIDLGGQAIDTSTALGKFFLTVIAGAAEMERNLISERTRNALGHLKKQNKRISRYAPYGFKFQGEYIKINDEEQKVIIKAKALKELGHTYYRIAKILNNEGYRSRSSGPFAATQIRKMLGA